MSRARMSRANTFSPMTFDVTVDAIFQDAIVPRRPSQQLFFEQRRKGPAA